jgi:hypothetical protein
LCDIFYCTGILNMGKKRRWTGRNINKYLNFIYFSYSSPVRLFLVKIVVPEMVEGVGLARCQARSINPSLFSPFSRAEMGLGGLTRVGFFSFPHRTGIA